MARKASKNDFFGTVLTWDVHPDRDQAWFEDETKNMSRRQIAQELECNFNMSGETVFHPEDMTRIESTMCEPKHKTGFDRNFWIWEEYSPECNYLLVADVARGDGKDFSAFHLFNVETMEIVAEYQGKPTLDIFANLLSQVGAEYGNCMLVVENNSVGWTVLDKLQENNYPNIYYSYKTSHEYVDPLIGEHTSSAIPGFSMTSKTRPLVIAKMEELVRNKLIKIYSKRLYNEMKTFVWHRGRPQAMKKYNDDLVTSCAIGCWIRDTVFSANQREAEYKKAFLNSIKISSTSLNTSIPGMTGYREIEKKKENQKNKDFVFLIKG